MRPYKRFRAWQLAHDLVLRVRRTTETWPRREWYGLAAQGRRAATSVTSNIVEGSARRGPAEFRRFADIAVGSLAEVEYQLRLGRDLKYVDATEWAELDLLVAEAGRCLHGLTRSLQRARAHGP